MISKDVDRRSIESWVEQERPDVYQEWLDFQDQYMYGDFAPWCEDYHPEVVIEWSRRNEAGKT